MNYQPFNDLAQEAIRYMNPETDWRFIHADCYTFYNLTTTNRYMTSLPAWEEKYHQPCFTEIRNFVKDPNAIIDNFTLVVANKHTICHPVRGYSGIITLQGNAYAAINNNQDAEAFHHTKLGMYRRMESHSPHLVRWGDMNMFGFDVSTEKALFPGPRIFNYYPRGNALFWYFAIKDEGGGQYGAN